MLIDPIVLNNLLIFILMLGLYWGWIRHPVLMYSGLVLYLVYCP